jgi:hypothetical protein
MLGFRVGNSLIQYLISEDYISSWHFSELTYVNVCQHKYSLVYKIVNLGQAPLVFMLCVNACVQPLSTPQKSLINQLKALKQSKHQNQPTAAF